MGRALLGILFIALLAPAFMTTLPVTGSAQDPPTWTVMVYMAADSEPELPWEDDINEMERAPYSPNVDTIALVDPVGPGNSRILQIVHDANLSDVIVSTEVNDGGAVIPGNEVNTADPATLADFVEFAAGSYPADRFVLVLWGHGAGWRGLCADGFQLMSLPSLRAALASATSSAGRAIDMVVVDACAEATLETMFELEGYARYLVASELSVPYEGLPYEAVLRELTEDPDITVADFGRHVASAYTAWSELASPYSTTMALIDLSALDSWSSTFGDLLDLGTRFDRLFHGELRAAFEDADAYEAVLNPDLGHLLQKLMLSDLPIEMKFTALQASEAYHRVVVGFERYVHPDPFDGVFAANSSGVTVYATSSAPEDAAYSSLRISATSWDELSILVRRNSSSNESMEGPELSFTDGPDIDGLSDAVHLGWPEAYDGLHAWVFRQEPGGLVFVSELTGGPAGITIESIPGRLLISASADDNGSAVTYDLVNATLYGVVTVEVDLVLDGASDLTDYEVSVVGGNHSVALALSGGLFSGSLAVPDAFDVGETVAIEVTDKRSGEVVSTRYTSVPASQLQRAVVVTGAEGGGESVWVLLVMSLVPGVILVVFDLMLYRDLKKKPR